MDKRRLDQTGGRRSTNGPTAPGPTADMRKVNNDEDSYFEGTGVAKNKRGRKPRPELGPPPGFTLPAGTSHCQGPPPVNAWSQKKGSDLFEKSGDEYDKLLERVKEDSMKTLEEDRKRQQERMMMMNREVPSVFDEDSKVEGKAEEQGSSSPTQYATPPSTFDSGEEYPVQDTWVSQGPRKSATPPTSPDKRNSGTVVEETSYRVQTDKRRDRVPAKSSHNNYRGFSKTDSHDSTKGASTTAVKDNDQANEYEMVQNSFEQESGLSQVQDPTKSLMIPEDEEIVLKDSELADYFKTTLTFGNTQGILENLNKGQLNEEPPVFDDVDVFLHKVMRHEPAPVLPVQVEPDGIFQLDDAPKVLEAQKERGSNPLDFVNMNRQASSPQFSDSSSSQSPFGSVGKQSYNYEQSPQASPPANQVPYPFGLASTPDLSSLVNQNMMAQMAAAYMRAAAAPGMFPVPAINPMTGLPLLPHMVMPTIPGQDLSNPLYQQMILNSYYAQMALLQNQMTAVTTEQQQFQNNHSQNYQNQKVPQTSESNPVAQTYPMNQNQLNQNQQIPEHNSILQNYPVNQNQKISGMSGSTPTMQNYPMNLSQQIPPMPQNSSILQNYPNQNQKIPEISGSTPTTQNYPMNQSQQIPPMPLNSSILQNYPNQNQKIPEMSGTTPTTQNYLMNQQTPPMPQNSSILQNYPNQNQKIPEMSGTTPTMQNYLMNQQIPQMPDQNQQIPQNSPAHQNYAMTQNHQIPQIPPTPQNYAMTQNHQIPQNPPAQQNYAMTQNQQIPQDQQIPNNTLNHQNYLYNQNQPIPQMPHYHSLLMQAPQMMPNADPENALQQNQLPMNNVNAVPQQGVGKNPELMMKLGQAMEEVNKLCREMGGQVPGYFPTMPQYPLMEQPPAQVQTPPVSCDGYESSDSQDPPSQPHSPLPDVAPKGRGQGHRP